MADDGRGVDANIDEITAETRKGRQVVNLKPQSKLKIVRPIPANADFVTAIGDHRKLVVFPLSELPEMARGQGVQLQRYRDGGLSDAIAFRLEDGLRWTMGGESRRVRTEADLTPWRVARGEIGRASCRERVWQYGESAGGGVTLKKKTKKQK